jgi:hypothetical protein
MKKAAERRKKMRNKWKTATLAVAASFFMNAALCATAFADNLDTYRNLLMNKTYTIKYVNITFEPRQTNRDKTTLIGSNYMDIGKVDALLYVPTQSVIVSDKDRRYEEVGYDAFTSCRLQLGNKTYVFTRTKVKDTYTWFGTKKGEVVSTKTNRYAQLLQGDGYGNETMTRMLNACLPNNRKGAGTQTYTKVGEGWLDNGLNYIDYRSDASGSFEVIRYYFKDWTLIKIASGMYILDKNGEIVDGHRNIIHITEFKPVAEEDYLKLPEGLKDKTKGAKKDAAGEGE